MVHVLHRRALWRAFAVIAALSVALAGAAIVRAPAAHAYPGLDEIEAARAAVADASSNVDQLDAALASLEQVLLDAEVAALRAGELYVQAQQASLDAQKRLELANTRAAAAEESLNEARADLAAVAMEAYRAGGSIGSLEAILTADGFEDVIVRSEARDRAAVQADDSIQRVKAAELVSVTMRDHAIQAAADAAAAEIAAKDALAAAEQAERDAQTAVAEVEATRAAAVERLAQLRNVSVELERQRQEGLAAARDEADRQAREEEGGGSPGVPGTPPGPETGGSWSSTADQASRAADFAVTLMGAPYVLGGNGPGYDCSGITMASYRSVGITLGSRSSQGQYNTSAKVPLSQMRKGDLVFYGTGGSSSQIYHVAIYIGNGLVAEATSYGKPAQIRAYDASWRVGNLIPYVGRP
jgi:cell wall-associated NlpC family hydrolase